MQISYEHDSVLRLIALTIELAHGGRWVAIIDDDEAELLSQLVIELGESDAELSFHVVYDLLVAVTGRDLCEY